MDVFDEPTANKLAGILKVSIPFDQVTVEDTILPRCETQIRSLVWKADGLIPGVSAFTLVSG